MKFSLLLCPLMGVVATAQSFVPPPKNMKVVLSSRFPGASISYKQVHNLCETTEGVRSFSGYVKLPKRFIPDAAGWDDDTSGNFFFWYFEARNNPENAPTSIYLGGGPGHTSFDGSSAFPCNVNPDSNSTTLNKNSFNNHVNMLYVDQPLGTGFSYTTLRNGTFNLIDKTFTVITDGKVSASNLTHMPATLDELAEAVQVDEEKGTLSPTKYNNIATNTTMTAARTFWRFSQVWFNDFPEKNTKNDKISIWAVSYGGLYATTFTSYFMDQNELISNKRHELANATILDMGTVGVINALVDARSMALGYPEFALKNTYGLPAYNESVYNEVKNIVTKADNGCYVLVDACRSAVARGDPENKGSNSEVNDVCRAAFGVCFGQVLGPYQQLSPYFQFDVTFNTPASFPTEYEVALFNQPWVQAELGVPLNYTSGNDRVFQSVFLFGVGDMMRYGLEYLGGLLNRGIKVAMVYGDRDYRCNWISAENASLNIPFQSASSFAAAGYESIITNPSYRGGFVRENGNLSFSRVFQAGHSAGGYQPETVSAIFSRAILGFDVATGKTDLVKALGYSSKGKVNIMDEKNETPDLIENICYVLEPGNTCTLEQQSALVEGTAVTKDFIVISPAGTKGVRLTPISGGQGSGGGSAGGGNNTGTGGGGNSGSINRVSWVIAFLPIGALISFL